MNCRKPHRLTRLLRLVLVLGCTAFAGLPIAQAQTSTNTAIDSAAVLSDPAQTGFNYLVVFYPRWFTGLQSLAASSNQLIAPSRISPLYQSVVAINDDTLYASSFIDSSAEPVIVTVPATSDVYSVLQLDQYGQALPGIPSRVPGTYALTTADWSGSLPAGVTRINMPNPRSLLIFRADKYAASGQDMQDAATSFRLGLHAAALSAYLQDSTAGAINIRPELTFSVPFKLTADASLNGSASSLGVKTFLGTLRGVLASSSTQPMTAPEQNLAAAFNAYMNNPLTQGRLVAGAQQGYNALVANYQNHTLPGSSWVSFSNMAAWADQTLQDYLDRASIAEFLEFGNNHQAAAYFHAFKDINGNSLNGASTSYTLTFPAGQAPAVSRFWSLTAYTPDSVELVSNLAFKYVVASYTPGLVKNADGSITITLSVIKPFYVPQANWLPIPAGNFNVMLRAYGPQGSVAAGSYTPPPLLPGM